MSEPTPTVLRETKIGQKGFIKEDVITYLDELNSKIVALEDENKSLKENGSSDPQEITKYKNQVENLQEKLNTSNNALRAAKKENEELQKTIAQLKAAAGQGGGQANAAAAAALEAAKKEIETLKEQLRAAEQKAAAGAANPQANAQTTAALEAAKKEIEDLRNRLKAAEQKAAAGNAGGAAEGEIAKVKQELAKISEELSRGLLFVRVDLYDVGGEVYFGEYTFTPAAGVIEYYKQRALDHLGKKINLNKYQ